MLPFLLACAHLEFTPSDGAPNGGGAAESAPAGDVVLTGATVVGLGRVDLGFVDGRVGETTGTPVEESGRWIVPAFIDSHVHLAYLPEPDAMAAGGVAGVVDLAAPVGFLAQSHAPLRFLGAGPMLTAPAGYPLNSWGADGYGLGVVDAPEAAAAVDALVEAGAGMIKVPLAGGPELDDAAFAAVVAQAHARGVKVVVHALDADSAARAARLGADVLAHTPVEPALEAAAWKGRAVISTLGAFGGSATTRANLAALRDAGATVLYGTDFGNTRTPGVDPDELALLVAAGFSGAEILAAGTSTPAAYWGFSDLGALTPGKAASALVLDADPLLDPTTLGRPLEVWIDGVRVAAR